ncbi:hypothetical protein [Rivibacter subsaxonicus]|uniref:Uncharacterized protein n=1 Tax=Rivibacter subsaxonicus TaxID=457575 RepID=A0A4Q7VG13_9BURK|nr:hypothetical protein [Rivibacter subsaxonicus]RZT94928.1 hypothetical protein EV670_2674 [Rivibacter subsaxonicus]
MDRSSASRRGPWVGAGALVLSLLAVAWLAADGLGEVGATPVVAATPAPAPPITAMPAERTVRPPRASAVDAAPSAAGARSHRLQVCDATAVVIEADGAPPAVM